MSNDNNIYKRRKKKRKKMKENERSKSTRFNLHTFDE